MDSAQHRTLAAAVVISMSSAVSAAGFTVYETELGDVGGIQDFDGVTDLHEMTVSIGNNRSLALAAECYFRADLDRPGTTNDLKLASFYMRGSQPVVHISFPPFNARREDRIVYTVGTTNDGCGGIDVRLYVNEKFNGTRRVGGPGGVTTPPRPNRD